MVRAHWWLIQITLAVSYIKFQPKCTRRASICSQKHAPIPTFDSSGVQLWAGLGVWAGLGRSGQVWVGLQDHNQSVSGRGCLCVATLSDTRIVVRLHSKALHGAAYPLYPAAIAAWLTVTLGLRRAPELAKGLSGMASFLLHEVPASFWVEADKTCEKPPRDAHSCLKVPEAAQSSLELPL